MAYAVKTDMVTRYGEQPLVQLTDKEEPYTYEINDANLNAALDDASATIDLYLGGRYDLPLSDTPSALIDMCCILAFCRLSRGRMDDDTRTDYEDVIRRLEKIAKGDIKLDQGGDEPKSAAAIAKVDGPNRTFNRSRLKGF